MNYFNTGGIIMLLSERENILRVYRHQMPQRLPDAFNGIQFSYILNGFHERPPNNRGGKDWFGVEWVYEETGDAPVPDHSKPPILDDIKNWREKVIFPELDAWDWENAAKVDKVDYLDRVKKVYNLMLLCGPFERLHMLMGFENALYALVEASEEVKAFFDAFMDYKCRLIDKIAVYYKPDVISFHDDWGTQKNLFFSPATWRILIKPQIQKAVDCCHKNNIIFELHSCGKMEQIIPEFAEMGIDSFQGMSINDVTAMKKITGDRLTYTMVPDYQSLDAKKHSGSISGEELLREAVDYIMRCAEGGCFIPLIVPPNSWWAPAFFEAINKCRNTLYK